MFGVRLRVILLLVSVLILMVLLYFSDIGKVISVVSTARPAYIFAALGISIALWFIRAFKVKILINRIGVSMGFIRLTSLNLAACFVSGLTPGKIGEPFKSYAIKKATGHSISKTLPAVFMEKTFDIISTTLLSVIGLLTITMPFGVSMLVLGAIAVYGTGISLTIYMSSSETRLKKFSGKFLRFLWWFPIIKKVDAKMEGFARKFNKSIKSYRDFGVLAKTLPVSLLIWVLEGMMLYVAFLSVGTQTDPVAAVSFYSVAMLIGVLSFLPSGVGSSELVVVLLFTTVYGTPVHVVTASVLITRFFGVVVPFSAGALSMGSLNMKSCEKVLTGVE